MNELSLFTGSGGGLLASLLLGWKTIGAVEIDPYCCRVLEKRQEDGHLERFPIFQTDIRDFIRNGYANLYQGRVDVVSAGFPCQPFSNAGKRKGGDDRRNLWPETIEVVRRVRPAYCFFENVRGLLSGGYFGKVLYDLAESGYSARWCILSAAEVGAPHRRDRLWIVAHADSANEQTGHEQAEPPTLRGGRPGFDYQEVTWWESEPAVGRVANGVAARVDRLTALGNGQVPAVAATAWSRLATTND